MVRVLELMGLLGWDRFHEMTDIESLAEEIKQRHALRLDSPDSIPMVPRPFKPRPRPQTAIIARAAQRKITALTTEALLRKTLARWNQLAQDSCRPQRADRQEIA